MSTASVRDNVDQLEAFLSRRISEAGVERDDLERRGTAFGGEEGRRKLKRIGRAERMNAKKPHGVLANDLARLDLMPSIGKQLEPIKGKRSAFPIK